MQAESSSRPLRLIGVLHLPALPGAPSASPGLAAVVERAVADARVLWEGGIQRAILENLGDAPFTGGAVGPEVVAFLTRAALAVRSAVPGLDLGINVLRNDALSAMAIAAAVEASFVRVNVLAGASWTDQGLVQGMARDVLLLRRRLRQDGVGPIQIAADIGVKHAVPAGETDLSRLAHDTAGRGGADVLIVTGNATGAPASLADIQAVRRGAPTQPLWVGSGVTAASLGALVGQVDGAIVGTSLHEDARLERPLCPRRVHALVDALDRLT